MRPSIKLVALLALAFLATVFAFAVAPNHGRAMTIGGANALNIEGSPQCSGPPTAGNYLQFNSGQWCDAALPASPTLPSAFYSVYIATLNGQALNLVLGAVFPPVAGHIVAIDATQLVASAGCTTQAQICAMTGTTCVASGTLTLDTATTHASPTLSGAFSAAQQIGIKIATADAGCTTHAQAINVALTTSTP